MKIIFDTEKRTITEKAKAGDRQIPELKMTEEKLNMFATATAAVICKTYDREEDQNEAYNQTCHNIKTFMEQILKNRDI